MSERKLLHRYLELMCESQDDKVRMRNLHSAMDHDLNTMRAGQKLRMFSKDVYKKYPHLNQTIKVYFVGLTEYIYRLYGRQPPMWVDEQEYFLPELTFYRDIDTICSLFSEQSYEKIEAYKKACMEEALPEFLRHNLVVTDVLSAF